jgi:hypothetical protein
MIERNISGLILARLGHKEADFSELDHVWTDGQIISDIPQPRFAIVGVR